MYAVSPTVRAVFFVVCARAFVPAYLLDVTRRTEEVHRLSQRDRLCDDAAARERQSDPLLMTYAHRRTRILREQKAADPYIVWRTRAR